jgi:thiamine-monophosphate kinase
MWYVRCHRCGTHGQLSRGIPGSPTYPQLAIANESPRPSGHVTPQRSAGSIADEVRSSHSALGPGAEFDMVRTLISRWGPAARGIGSDCAVLDVPSHTRLVVSTDSSVEHVHFERDWLTPREIGYRATAAAWSDLAAAAAVPIGVLLAVTLPPEWRAALTEVADGVGESALDAGAPVIGGDITTGPVLVLTLTVIGVAPSPLSRVGARAGDRIYVTGTLGGPLSAIAAWRSGSIPDPASRARFAHPVPRLAEARWLREHGATAAIDVSDGLVADLGHVATASGVKLVLDLDRLPRWPGQSAIQAAASGEEYEIAVSAGAMVDTEAFQREFGLPLSHIGDVVAGPPGVEARVQGIRVDPARGYDHLSP